jgi:hypothetical protein
MPRDDRSVEFTAILVSVNLQPRDACELATNILSALRQALFIALSTIFVLLRCYCKLFVVKNFAADDYCSVLSLVSILVTTLTTFENVSIFQRDFSSLIARRL